MRLAHFVPTKHSRICGDHFISLDYYPSSRMLLKTSVPSVDFLQHLQKIVTERRQLQRKTQHIKGETVNEEPSFLKNVKLSPSKVEFKNFIQKQKKEIKILKWKVRRQQRKIDSLSGLLKDLKERIPVDQNTVVKLNNIFSGIYTGYGNEPDT